ncbi:MAG: transcription antitermination factor NusB [Acidimicrobiales bacterium]
MPDGTRHDARERALGLLYEAESKGTTPAEVVAALPVAPDTYAADVVVGVGTHMDAIDELLRRFARNWDLERMPSLDRAVLRMATYELAHRPDVPRNVVLNEAVELAKTFSTEGSGRFVNGMLSRIADEVRPPTAADA